MRIHSRRTHYCRRVVGDFPPRSCGHALSRKHATQASLHRRSKILLWGKVFAVSPARPRARPYNLLTLKPWIQLQIPYKTCVFLCL
jgi:hypothetical protein